MARLFLRRGGIQEATMKRIFVIVGLLLGLASGVATAQTRLGISLSFGDPYFYHRYARPHYYRYRPVPVIVVGPRYYHAPRVIVVRPHRRHVRQHHRGW
jgi:hypothetical protein